MQKTIIVKDIIDSINCYDRDQGELLYKAMSTELKKHNQLEIDFKDIEVVTSTFISSSFANLIVCSSAIKFIKENIKVVFIGMCPYHTRYMKEDIADGLCFSTKMKEAPPSLKVLHNAIRDDLQDKEMILNNDLTYLANQGILMLNAGMTTSYLKVGNHIEKWEIFHKYLYENVFNTLNGLIFIYFGKEAQKLKKYEMPFIHYSKSIEHPTYSVRENRDLIHQNIFSYINKLIEQNNGEKHKIMWEELPF